MLRTDGGVFGGVFGVRDVRWVLDVEEADEGRGTVVVRFGTVEDTLPGLPIFDELREGEGLGIGLGDLPFIGGVEGRAFNVTLTLSAFLWGRGLIVLDLSFEEGMSNWRRGALGLSSSSSPSSSPFAIQ